MRYAHFTLILGTCAALVAWSNDLAGQTLAGAAETVIRAAQTSSPLAGR
jgi:hypothetical protein